RLRPDFGSVQRGKGHGRRVGKAQGQQAERKIARAMRRLERLQRSRAGGEMFRRRSASVY
ncbi:MAG: hypothetical protein QGF68_05775, partial [Nitrospinota bacterium]|nr:hypothetical protein [Nitrospinota bacterium]